MSIITKICRIKDNLKWRYRYWKSVYFFWMLKPKVYAVPIIALVAVLLSTYGILETGVNQIIPKAAALESVARTVEQTPDLWQKTLDAKRSKGEISDYRYQLEMEQMKYFARHAPELAENIRTNKSLNVFIQSGMLSAIQTTQFIGGKAAGRVTRYIGTKRIVKTYLATGHNLDRTVESMQFWNDATQLTDDTFNLSWELMGLSTEGNQATPKLEMALKSQGFADLFELIKTATEQQPDKLMQAALLHQINMLISKNDPNIYTDEEYKNLVMSLAGNLIKLTQSGGSPESMWRDENDLAKWLAVKARRPLPGVSEDSIPSSLFPFAKIAIGSFLPPLPKELEGCQGNIIDFTFALGSYSYETHQVEKGLVQGTGRLRLRKAGYEQFVSFTFNTANYLPDLGTMEGEVTVTRTANDTSGEKKYSPGVIHWHGKKSGNPRFFETGDLIEGTFDKAFDIFPKGFSFSLTIG
jgi:hypothetical protein